MSGSEPRKGLWWQERAPLAERLACPRANSRGEESEAGQGTEGVVWLRPSVDSVAAEGPRVRLRGPWWPSRAR